MSSFVWPRKAKSLQFFQQPRVYGFLNRPSGPRRYSYREEFASSFVVKFRAICITIYKHEFYDYYLEVVWVIQSLKLCVMLVCYLAYFKAFPLLLLKVAISSLEKINQLMQNYKKWWVPKEGSTIPFWVLIILGRLNILNIFNIERKRKLETTLRD